MRIRCPHCGERDSREFSYLGDATLRRPDAGEADPDAMAAYLYQRANPAGDHRELWYHTPCRAWVRVARDTRTHGILGTGPAGPTGAETAP